ncbi:MAG: hypothetical protein WCO55_06020 [Candidatus Falkowbacteria bacterium]
MYTAEYAQLFSLPFWEAIYRIFFWYFGWLPVAVTFLYGASILWLDYCSGKWAATQKFVLLAIDVPKMNDQSPKAVENLFTYLMGVQSNPNLLEVWWEGKFQLGFSFEIVGIDGYIQFLVRTPSAFRPNIETAIYSQYPDAEISEVSDYLVGVPEQYPDAEYDIWGAEMMPVASQYLPIRCYKEFSSAGGAPGTSYKDPLATLMDLMSSFRPGEQLWFQMVLVPADAGWTKGADAFIAKLIGDKEKIMIQTPIERKQVEMASEKKNKVAFHTKMRVVYFAKKKLMDKAKVVNGFMGYMRQFGEGNLNGFRPYSPTMTSTSYFMAASRLNSRKNNILSAYRGRSLSKGSNSYVLNVEELATLWHLPLDAVTKAPLLQRAAARRIEAPMSLPTMETAAAVTHDNIFATGYTWPEEKKAEEAKIDFNEFLAEEIKREEHQEEIKEDRPPGNLPFVD